MINVSDRDEDDGTARAALSAVGRPGADTRSQIGGLEAEPRHCPQTPTMTGCAYTMLWQPTMTTWPTTAAPSATATGTIAASPRARRQRLRYPDHLPQHRLLDWAGRASSRGTSVSQQPPPDREQVLARITPTPPPPAATSPSGPGSVGIPPSATANAGAATRLRAGPRPGPPPHLAPTATSPSGLRSVGIPPRRYS